MAIILWSNFLIIQCRWTNERRTWTFSHDNPKPSTIQNSKLVPQSSKRYFRRKVFANFGQWSRIKTAWRFGTIEEDSSASWYAALLGFKSAWAAYKDYWKTRSNCGCIKEKGLNDHRWSVLISWLSQESERIRYDDYKQNILYLHCLKRLQRSSIVEKMFQADCLC